MSIGFSHNIIAQRIVGHLDSHTTRLSDAVERLSSGLRIGRSADDPTGLAIGAKLRTQIAGVNRASLNAQDGTSLLQVAEGALGEIHSLLERARTLAVTAASGTYTWDDRQEIQSEVDSLLEEVDRVASTTRFNGRSLLDGSASGVAATSSSTLGVTFRGTPASGSYRLTASATPGEAQVLKSGAFSLADGATRGRASEIAQTIVPGFGSRDLTGFSDLDYTVLPYGSDGNREQDFQLEVYAPASDEVAVVDHRFAASSGKQGFQIVSTAPLAAGTSGYYEIEIKDVEGDAVMAANDETVTATVRRYSAEGELLESGEVTTTKSDVVRVPSPASVGWFESLSGGPSQAELSVRLADVGDRLEAGDRWLLAVNSLADVTGNVIQLRQDTNELSGVTTATSPTGTGTFGAAGEVTVVVAALDSAGRELGRTGPLTTQLASATDELGISWEEVPGAASWRIYSGDAGAGITGYVDVAAPATSYTLSGPGALGGAPPFADAWSADQGQGSVHNASEDRVGLWTSLGATLSGGSEHPTSLARYDQEGTVHFSAGSVRLGVPGSTPVAGTAEFNMLESSLAERNTRLSDVDRFRLANGDSLLDVGQTLTVYGNGRSTSVVLEGGDTLEELAARLRDAITGSVESGGLGMGRDANSLRTATGAYLAGVDGNASVFVDDPALGTDEAIEGTLVLRSLIAGTRGELAFAGDARLLDGLSFGAIREATDGALEVTAFDADTDTLLGRETTADGIVRGLLAGVELTFAPTTDIEVAWNEARRAYDFASASGEATLELHLDDTSLKIQTGANEGEALRAGVGDVSLSALGLTGLLVANTDDASDAIARLDRALDRVSAERARVGAWLSRLETTGSVLTATSGGLTATDSRIRDTDIAEETVAFTRDQILQQVSIAMLAQANAMPQSVLKLLQ